MRLGKRKEPGPKNEDIFESEFFLSKLHGQNGQNGHGQKGQNGHFYQKDSLHEKRKGWKCHIHES